MKFFPEETTPGLATNFDSTFKSHMMRNFTRKHTDTVTYSQTFPCIDACLKIVETKTAWETLYLIRPLPHH